MTITQWENASHLLLNAHLLPTGPNKPVGGAEQEVCGWGVGQALDIQRGLQQRKEGVMYALERANRHVEPHWPRTSPERPSRELPHVPVTRIAAVRRAIRGVQGGCSGAVARPGGGVLLLQAAQSKPSLKPS